MVLVGVSPVTVMPRTRGSLVVPPVLATGALSSVRMLFGDTPPVLAENGLSSVRGDVGDGFVLLPRELLNVMASDNNPVLAARGDGDARCIGDRWRGEAGGRGLMPGGVSSVA